MIGIYTFKDINEMKTESWADYRESKIDITTVTKRREYPVIE